MWHYMSPMKMKTMMLLLMSSMILATTMMLTKNKTMYMSLKLLKINNLQLNSNLIMDTMTTSFIAIILMISSMILTYSNYYITNMKTTPYLPALSLFILSMITLITTDNLILMILGWDGLGLSSYILIIHYQDWTANSSASLTMMTNRLGDTLIITSITMMTQLNSWSLSTQHNPLMTLLMLTLAASTKSAQYPFSSWLPAAMAAPTPVSALVHSSTLVTAGILLMLRMNSSMHMITMKMLLIMAMMTALNASISANWETDSKKIIALSTLSQVAFMMLTISKNMPNLALFHLYTHALFKATMFMSMGIPIHSSSYQDTRMSKYQPKNSPMSSSTFGATSMALMGLPFMAGFYSKDSILEKSTMTTKNTTITMLINMTIGLTTIYNLRMSLNLMTKMSPTLEPMNHSNNMMKPTMYLTPMSIVLGALTNWMFTPNMITMMMPMKKTMPLVMITTGAMAGIMMNKYNLKTNTEQTSTSMWLMNYLTSIPLMNATNQSTNMHLMDTSWNEKTSTQSLQTTILMNKTKKMNPITMTTLTLITTTLLLMYQ